MACVLAARFHAAPRLRALADGGRVHDALIALTLPHLVRPISLLMLAPGVVHASMTTQPDTRAWAERTATGDLVAASLALLAVIALRMRLKGALVVAAVAHAVGAFDALFNFANGARVRAVEHMGLGVVVPAYVVPIIVVTHVLAFWVIARARRTS